jgi:16S rRNA (guanine966-N2)-methyltransferase
MRVIGGEFRSRRLKSLPGLALRPTPDRLRETLFDILAARVEGATFVDAYAGTGAVGIEALSRGAREAVFVDYSHAAVDTIRQNLRALGIEERAQVFRGKALVVLERLHSGIVFLDPPYDKEKEYSAALDLLGGAPPDLVIAQHAVRCVLPERCGALGRTRAVRQGDNVLTFYARVPY